MSRNDLSKLSILPPDVLINFTSELFKKILSYEEKAEREIGQLQSLRLSSVQELMFCAGFLTLPGISAQITNELTAKLTSLILDGAKMDLSSNDFRYSILIRFASPESHNCTQVKPGRKRSSFR
jgi:hypothetical protein